MKVILDENSKIQIIKKSAYLKEVLYYIVTFMTVPTEFKNNKLPDEIQITFSGHITDKEFSLIIIDQYSSVIPPDLIQGFGYRGSV